MRSLEKKRSQGSFYDQPSNLVQTEKQYPICKLEDLIAMTKFVNYSTRTLDDQVQYLSIMVLAEPHPEESQPDS